MTAILSNGRKPDNEVSLGDWLSLRDPALRALFAQRRFQRDCKKQFATYFSLTVCVHPRTVTHE
jgi:hypothetical protein